MDNQVEARRSDHVCSDDVGTLFIDPDGNVWKMVSYCGEPQATFERQVAETQLLGRITERREHVVGCLNHHAMGLKRLVRENP